MSRILPIMLLLAVAAFASDPRLAALGGDPRLLVNDYLEMWAYPGNIGDYEFVSGGSDSPGNTSDGWFGITKDFSGKTVGVTVNHGGYSHEVLYGPGDWGAILGFDFDKFAPDSITTQRDMEIGLAWGTDVSALADYSDLAFAAVFERSTTDIGEIESTNTDMIFSGSLRGHRSSFMNLFPIVSASVELGTFDQTSGGEMTSTGISFDFGAGHNRKIADETILIMGVYTGFQSTSYGGDNVDADPDVYLDVPRIIGGVEQQVADWLTFRIGATSENIYYMKGDFNQFSNDFDTYFGVGLHWDNFDLDGTIGEGFLHDGPYLIGGDSNGFLGAIAATYTF